MLGVGTHEQKGSAMTPYAKLKELQITLPESEVPVAAFVPTVRTGNLLFVSGHIAKRDGKPWVGKLGVQLSTQEGKLAARSAAIELLATLHHELQDLERVKRRQDALSGDFLAAFYRAAFGRKWRLRALAGGLRSQGKPRSGRFRCSANTQPALKSN
jgi:hypothetical protein